MKTEACAPFLKWAGGKRQLLKQMAPFLPPDPGGTYYEPFLGAGAVFFHLLPHRACVNDANRELINVYTAVRDDLQGLMRELATHRTGRDYFYRLRNLDRDPDRYATLTATQRAARIIYLNKTCYNGLFRVNTKGEFNAPYGRHNNPAIINTALLQAVSSYLNGNNIRLSCTDFEEAVSEARHGDFVYFDPPYVPLSETASFTCYGNGGFTLADQERLAEVYRRLDKQGCRLMLSNSDTQLVRKLYEGFRIHTLSAARCINSVSSGRGRISELLITNYTV